jgi:hypothetical protein
MEISEKQSGARLAQQCLDEHGYLVIHSWNSNRAVGDVITIIFDLPWAPAESVKVRVVGSTNNADGKEQLQLLGMESELGPGYLNSGYFYRVVAE